MNGYWAVPIVFVIALMLGFTPVQSNAEDTSCDEIEELIIARKIPAEVGAKILEKADCDTQVVKITAIIESTGEPAEGANCRISLGEGLFVEGLTDVNGEVVLIVPAEIDSVSQIHCAEAVLVPPGPSGRQCNVSLTGFYTEVEIVIGSSGSVGCF